MTAEHRLGAHLWQRTQLVQHEFFERTVRHQPEPKFRVFTRQPLCIDLLAFFSRLLGRNVIHSMNNETDERHGIIWQWCQARQGRDRAGRRKTIAVNSQIREQPEGKRIFALALCPVPGR